jgi:hypothetical protein
MSVLPLAVDEDGGGFGQIMEGMAGEYHNIGILANYGSHIGTGKEVDSDFIIDTVNTSGATPATFGERFPEGYKQLNTTCTDPTHNHVSPTRTLDASTCYLPENTWFNYEQYHTQTWWDTYTRALLLELVLTDNIKDVHAYGIEMKGDLDVALSEDWHLGLDGTLSWTPSINEGEPRSPADQSVGKQLPYVPEYSSAVTGRLTWKTWSFLYKWCYYSERFTMSSNDITLTGKLPEYFMSNISLEKTISCKWADFSIKGAINNLFNEEYLSVLSRPMPGINFEVFLGITPKFK